jgi:hypothetical protein
MSSTLLSIRSSLSFLVAIVAVSLTLLPDAVANCRVPQPKANTEFFKSDFVFTGKVTSVRTKYLEGNYVEGWFYHLRVTKVFRGAIQDNAVVYTGNDSNRFSLEDGREYLLFAYRNKARLEIDHCGVSALLSEAQDSIHRLEQIPLAGHFGEIEGWVVGETGGVDVSGVQVIIQGKSEVYSAITDNEGRFHMRVPSGRYRVDFRPGEYYINDGDSFWDDPDHFIVHTGGCAVLQLVSVRHPATR